MNFIANRIDIIQRSINLVKITIDKNLVQNIEIMGPEDPSFNYILPGLVDAHVHIESSMLTPQHFAQMSVVHGTVATVSDPHEIGNVLGVTGIEYMLEDAKKVNFTFCFGVPSCVPATEFETSGATIAPNDIDYLFSRYSQMGYLAEVMNFPAVINHDPKMMEKIKIAKKHNKPLDGHAPKVLGDKLDAYLEAGITTDHECTSYDEAIEKLQKGMKILIREGSAAKNYEALHTLIDNNWENLMFCSDDMHPDSLELGHINLLVKRSINYGHDLFKVLQIACINPVLHYRLPNGMLQLGDRADWIEIDNPQSFNVKSTFIDGKLVAKDGKSLIKAHSPSFLPNQFNISPIALKELSIHADQNTNIRVIEALNGQLITHKSIEKAKIVDGKIVSDIDIDVLKIVVINRYSRAKISQAFIRGFGLKHGAIGTSVAHDSHNVVIVGVEDEDILKSANMIIDNKGGLSISYPNQSLILPLPIAGLLSDLDGFTVSNKYKQLDYLAKKDLGCILTSPFMTLSFMALLVIPSLKISDKGLFDGEKFAFISPFVS